MVTNAHMIIVLTLHSNEHGRVSELFYGYAVEYVAK
jgi:hypothetical protein